MFRTFTRGSRCFFAKSIQTSTISKQTLRPLARRFQTNTTPNGALLPLARRPSLFGGSVRFRAMPNQSRRMFSSYNKDPEINPIFLLLVASGGVMIAYIAYLFSENYYQETYLPNKQKRERGTSREIFRKLSQSDKEMQKGYYITSKDTLNDAVKKFNPLLSKTLSCIQLNSDDMKQQLKVLWGTADTQLITKKQQEILIQIANLSHQQIKAIERCCKTNCTDTNKTRTIKRSEELQRKISNFPLEPFTSPPSSYEISHYLDQSLDRFEKQMKTSNFDPIVEENDFNEDFNKLAEKCRYIYLPKEDAQARESLKERFFEVSNQFIDKLKLQTNLPNNGDIMHRTGCHQTYISDISKRAVLAKTLSTEFELQLQSLTATKEQNNNVVTPCTCKCKGASHV